MTLVHKRTLRAGNLRRVLFDQAIAAVVIHAVLAGYREQPVQQARGLHAIGVVIGADHRKQAFEWKVLCKVQVGVRVVRVLLVVRIEVVELIGGLANPVLDDVERDAFMRRAERDNFVDGIVGRSRPWPSHTVPLRCDRGNWIGLLRARLIRRANGR